MAELKPCGTAAAYRRHKRLGQPIDDACAAAGRDQKNERVADKRISEAERVAAAFADQAKPESVDRLEDALETLAFLKAAMSEAPANAMAGLARQRVETVALIARLSVEQNPVVSKLDQLAQRREARLAAS